MAFKILIAEDEEITVKHLVKTLTAEGYAVASTLNGIDALAKLESGSFDILIADIKMPGLTGIELLEKIREKQIEVEVIIITGFGSIGSAVEAMKKGALEYVTKPFDLDELVLKVNKIRDQKILKKENIALKAYAGMDKKVSIIARSASMNNILSTIDGMKDSDCNVLLTGETGVGKSLLAKIIHFTSRRQGMPFLSINCATLTEELLASELFGHEKGAFTGATSARRGKFELADGGTLFLDEVGDLHAASQAKLLRVLQEGEFHRVGGEVSIRVSVRVISATNRELTDMVAQHIFREDLYYRLCVVPVRVPSLRERREDIRPLAEYFLAEFCARNNFRPKQIAHDVFETLENYGWPGNIRELRNAVERMAILTRGDLLEADAVPVEIRIARSAPARGGNLREAKESAEREHILKALEESKWNVSSAARVLGMERTNLHKRIRALGLVREK
jgi:two-component system nitrogen regulation response regulator NtrX